ncbi:MAG: hypothetical protein DI570_09815 [Phenylobacterium zucineum]|nr:MAG: hypothetical protein DI570_09815 [Phenylobacterium zucineum]
MTMDYTGREPNNSVTDAEGVMFAANPVWDRTNRKRRGLGGGRRNAERVEEAPNAPTEPRSFAAEPDVILHRPVIRPVERPLAGDVAYVAPAAPTVEEAEVGMFAPIDRASAKRSTRARSSGGVAPAAIATGAVALVAVGAAGWWATRDTGGVPEMTPGSTVSEAATAPIAPVPLPDAPVSQAVNAPPAATPAPTRIASAEPVRAERRAPAVRTRPAAAAPSADSAAVNTSATLPAGPQPYTALNPGSATTPAPAAEPQTLTIPPAQAAPIPSTPPTAPEPAPTTTPDPTPAAPDTTTPPQ